MHPNKPYWIAVFVSVGCLRTLFRHDSSRPAHSIHLVPSMPPPPGTRSPHPHFSSSSAVLTFTESHIQKGKAVKDDEDTYTNESREFLDRANAFT